MRTRAAAFQRRAGDCEWSAGRLLQPVEADDRAGQQHQRIEPLRGTLIADAQPPEAAQPGPGALDHPAVTTKPLGGLNHAPGDPRADATSAQIGAAAAMIVGLISV